MLVYAQGRGISDVLLVAETPARTASVDRPRSVLTDFLGAHGRLRFDVARATLDVLDDDLSTAQDTNDYLVVGDDVRVAQQVVQDVLIAAEDFVVVEDVVENPDLVVVQHVFDIDDYNVVHLDRTDIDVDQA